MSLTGEYDPTSNLQLALLGLVLVAGMVVALRRSDARERRGTLVALGLAAGVLALPLAVDVVGREILTAKNLIPAVPLAAIGIACALGARRAGGVGVATAAFVATACLAITVATLAEPRLHRPDYRGIAEALGRPDPSTGVVTPYHGSTPVAHYAPGVVMAAPEGTRITQLVVAVPLGRADGDDPERPATPPPPQGFDLVGREDHDTFTRVSYRAAEPATLTTPGLSSLVPGTPTFPPVLLVWPPG
jgi:hypothetical protein